jgi:choline-sulfatase
MTCRLLRGLAGLAVGCAMACGGSTPAPAPRPSILLVTLDTTRADAIGPDAAGVETPSFNALAQRGRRYRQAYAAAPETLPSHSSIMTGLYPGGHGVHENGRRLADEPPVLAEGLQKSGYQTAAFVSSYILTRRYGLARGFQTYDDELAGDALERSSKDTTDRAVAFLERAPAAPVFLWVHYFDPHTPYAPAEPYRTRYAAKPYLGEIAAMDEQFGRLLSAFERRAPGPHAIAVTGDHGEGLGDHGEKQHGNLLYQSTVRVPLVLAGPGISGAVTDEPVSIRRLFHTIRDWAGLEAANSLRPAAASPEVVLGEAMKPFLNYGWQPQIMAIAGSKKGILSGRLEVFDVVADPQETRDLSAEAASMRAVSQAVRDYPVPSPDAVKTVKPLNDADRSKLSSLGYVSSGAAPVVRKEAPRPADMTPLFDVLEQASGLFVAGRYADVIPLLKQILARDPANLDAALRLATAYSSLKQDAAAMEAFKQAAALAPKSYDVRLYLALHYARSSLWPQAEPLLEQVLQVDPDRLPALEALATIRAKQGRAGEALQLWQRVQTLRASAPADLNEVGRLAMALQRTDIAIQAFERAHAVQGTAFPHDLELGVLYLSARRFSEARDALDRVPASHPDYPMALFKRAQVSVLLNEPDQARRIQLARAKADATTRPLIASEKLFQGK